MLERRSIYILIGTLAALTILTMLFFAKGDKALVDFSVFHQAGERFIDGDQLYQTSDGHYKFKYFPVSALFFSALGWLPLAAAKYIWLLVVSSAVGGLLWISQKLLGADARNTRLAVVLTGLILARFYIRELELGQVNAVIALTLAGATWFMIRSRPCLAGLLIGLAIALKPHALIFLPYLAIRREWRGCLTAIGVLVGAMLLPVLRYGPQGFLDLLVSWKNTVSGSTPALLTNPDNVSIFGAWAKWLGPEPSTSSMIIAGTVLALLGIAAVIYSWRVLTETVPERIRSRALAVEGSILLMLIPLLSPQGWDHVFLAATPGVLILLTSWGQLERWKRWVLGVDLAVIGLTIYDIMGRELYRSFMDASALTVCFLIVLWFLIDLRKGLQGEANQSPVEV